MGRTLIPMLEERGEFVLSGAWVAAADRVAGQPVSDWARSRSGVVATTDPRLAARGADAIIDFTLPGATADVIDAARAERVPLICGTTGLDAGQLNAMAMLGREVAVVYERNMSPGVHALTALTALAARLLGEAYDIEILELHHRRKIDAPSGTALKLGEAAADARGLDAEAARVAARDGVSGPRGTGEIGFASLRGGGVAGEHTVYLIGEHDRIEITHRATSRRVFAAGALDAAAWAVDQPAGFYGLDDVLGLASS